MASVNKAILIGNLGRDAEMSYTAGGIAIAKFTLATTERFSTKNGEKKEETQWHRVTIWDRLAESVSQYLKKGKQVYVEGQIQYREYEKDGQKRWSTEIRGSRVVLLGGGRRDGGGGERDDAPEYNEPGPVGQAADDDDIPFGLILPLLIPLAAMLS